MPRNTDSPTQATPPSGYTIPPPFTADEFWEKILLLMREHDGYITKERFEDVFGVQLKQTKSYEDGSAMYSLKKGTDWYFDAGLWMTGEKFKKPGGKMGGVSSSLRIDWDFDTFGEVNVGPCIRTDTARKDILSSGWRQGIQERHRGAADEFYKNESTNQVSKITIFHSGDFASSCVKRITVNGRP